MDNQKPAKDKLHDSDLGETKDFNELSYNKDKNSFEFDVKGEEANYDHPLPYDTSAPNGEDSISTYDESNPYIGNEYDQKGQVDEQLEDNGMRVDETGESVLLDPADKILAQTEEDFRDDLDEEGYPKNDLPG
ncbi:hypothetical protein [Pedobacter chitinilyticus]|uniref:Uncharacterized protein n=1 Tax=Pedobacter chitinilyticus TaxID=2233776 RepID=A0A443YXG9_9SPHI|nr:hypothetical protein [Pedobacter chitinilyticus]RWU08669.1 hypothetical protein DPV69_09895 [Pedobacter chitinilyticus]